MRLIQKTVDIFEDLNLKSRFKAHGENLKSKLSVRGEGVSFIDVSEISPQKHCFLKTLLTVCFLDKSPHSKYKVTFDDCFDICPKISTYLILKGAIEPSEPSEPHGCAKAHRSGEYA